MPMDAGTGFASGLIAGQEAQQSLAMGGIKIQEEDIALKQAQMMLENQKTFAQQMAKLNSGGGAGPGQDSAGMAERLANKMFAVSDAALRSNMPEHAADMLKTGESIMKGHLELESAAFQRRLEGATLTSNMVKDIDPNDPKATDKFHSALVAWGGIMGKAAPPDLMQKPFTQELKDQLMAGSEKVKDEASRKLEEQRLKQSQAETVSADHLTRLRDAETRLDNARATAIEKAGGVGGKPPSGYQPKIDPKTGKPVLDESGRPVLEPIKGGPKDPESVTARSAYARIYAQRVGGAGSQAALAIKNITELPITATTGLFGTGEAFKGGLVQGPKHALENKMTTQEVQSYNTMIAGLNRNLATIETMGMRPGENYTGSFGAATTLRPGDSYLTKLRRLAEMRQIVERGLSFSLTSPDLTPKQKEAMQSSIDEVKAAVPYTQHDVTMLEQKGKDTDTIAKVAKGKGLGRAPDKTKSGVTVSDWD